MSFGKALHRRETRLSTALEFYSDHHTGGMLETATRASTKEVLSKGNERSYIFSLLNPLTTDTFYGVLSVCINGV